jgi:putative transposase
MKLDRRKAQWIIWQKQKRSAHKTDCVGYRNLAEINKSGKATKNRCGSQQLARIWVGPGSLLMSERNRSLTKHTGFIDLGLRMLEVVVRKLFKMRISHNRIHLYLKAAGLVHEDPQKKKRRKWVRYERKA